MQHIWELIGADAPLGLVILHNDGEITYINGRMLSWIKKTKEECLNRPFLSLFPEAESADWPYPHGEKFDCGSIATVSPSQQESTHDQTIRINQGRRQLTCLLRFPFRDEEDRKNCALLFYDADEQTGFQLGLALTIKRLQETQLDQRRLLTELEHASSHLIRVEKMAGIGQLAAGVAHEINNPIGYIFSNLKTLAGYMQNMIKIIDATDNVKSIEELRTLKQTLDYDYIRNDVEALIDESQEGIDRVKKIITALKDFSHIDEEGFHQADLHHAIETTLSVVNNELKYKAQLKKSYGTLPLVDCDISQIKQVIMNLLMNAAQALDEFGVITIRTGCEREWAWFEVEDDGKGMEPSIQDRIFEPFFTTKPLGQGTGLGLSLSYSIVHKHQGRIDLTSEPGKGSCFRVWLPIAH